MTDNSDNQDLQPAPDVDEERRSFLRKSVYAAYATPLITTLLVAEKAAAQSIGDCDRPWAWDLCEGLQPGDFGYNWCRSHGCLH